MPFGIFYPSYELKINVPVKLIEVFQRGWKSWGAFDSAKNHKRQRRKRQSVTAKREKSQTPKFV